MTEIKDILEDINNCDVDYIKKTYTKTEILQAHEEMILQFVNLIGQRLDSIYGIVLGHTGTINPEYYETHRKLGFDEGLKITAEFTK